MQTQLLQKPDSLESFVASLHHASGTAPSGAAGAAACRFALRIAASSPVHADALRDVWLFDSDALDWSYPMTDRALHCLPTIAGLYKPSLEDALLTFSALQDTFEVSIRALLDRVNLSDIFPNIETSHPTSTSDRLELDLIKALEAVPELRAVYVGQLFEEVQFLVLVEMDSYDLALIDRLVDIEASLRTNHPQIIMSFSYGPLHGQPHAAMAGEASRLLWEKVSFDDAAVA